MAKKKRVHPRAAARNSLAEVRREEAYRLWHEGWSQTKIADKLKISQPAVSLLLKTCKERTAEKYADTEAFVLRRLATLEEIARTEWEAWQRSQQDGEEVTTETDGNGVVTAKKRKRWGQHGDPRHLKTIIEAGQEQADLLGVYPAKKTALSVDQAVGRQLPTILEVDDDTPQEVIDAAIVGKLVGPTNGNGNGKVHLNGGHDTGPKPVSNPAPVDKETSGVPPS